MYSILKVEDNKLLFDIYPYLCKYQNNEQNLEFNHLNMMLINLIDNK